jgi:hypothetical protein
LEIASNRRVGQRRDWLQPGERHRKNVQHRVGDQRCAPRAHDDQDPFLPGHVRSFGQAKANPEIDDSQHFASMFPETNQRWIRTRYRCERQGIDDFAYAPNRHRVGDVPHHKADKALRKIRRVSCDSHGYTFNLARSRRMTTSVPRS